MTIDQAKTIKAEADAKLLRHLISVLTLKGNDRAAAGYTSADEMVKVVIV